MFEFLGFVFVTLIIYLVLNADKIDFTIKIDDKKIVDYHKDDSDEEK